MLARVGAYLLSASTPSRPETADPEIRTLGRTYIERALALQPDLTSARTALLMAERQERHARLWQAVNGKADVEGRDRIAYLAERAQHHFMRGESAEYYRKDEAAARTSWNDARAAADEALMLASGQPEHPDYSNTVMIAHHILGLLAFREGDRQRAVEHMNESARVPPLDESAFESNMVWLKLTNYLLKAGERDSVVQFLEAYAKISPRQRERLLEDAAAIRDARMPRSYQSMFAR
jgi:hypothetical protein